MISKDDVKHIASLARLRLNEKEIEKFQKELGAILDYIEKLKEVDVSEVSPTTHPRLSENVMREDVVQKKDESFREKLLNLFPEREGNFLKIKKVLKKDESF